MPLVARDTRSFCSIPRKIKNTTGLLASRGLCGFKCSLSSLNQLIKKMKKCRRAGFEEKMTNNLKRFFGEVIEPPSPRTERESVLVRYPAWRLPLWRNWFKDATALINDAANTNTNTGTHTKLRRKSSRYLAKMLANSRKPSLETPGAQSLERRSTDSTLFP